MLRLKPDSAQTRIDIGDNYYAAGCYDEAMKAFQEALKIDPHHADAHYNIGCALEKQNRYDQAMEVYKKTIALKPDYPEAHMNLALLLLLKGDYENGWKEYEWRFQRKDIKEQYQTEFPYPRWDGTLFRGKRLLVKNEQGMGDTLQLVRFLPLVKARGGTVIFEAEKPLFTLLAGYPWMDEIITFRGDEEPSDIDFYIYLFDLPKIFGTTLATIPAEIPYLHADQSKQELWKPRFTKDHLNVGLVWAGNPANKDDQYRSIPLTYLAPLWNVPGIQFYGLQKGEAALQAEALSRHMPLISLGDDLQDFSDTAAVLECLDLLIAVDTSVVHLAGAMGKPVWNLRPQKPYWVWMLDREDSPWYPSMRIFRQKQLGNWAEVIQMVSDSLRHLVAGEKF